LLYHPLGTQPAEGPGSEGFDIDGNLEIRADTVSVFDGPLPEVVVTTSEEDESKRVASWIEEGRRAWCLTRSP
jgi:hypothetical protein